VIVIDTSALIAILAEEAEASVFQDHIFDAIDARISAVSYYETLLVVERRVDQAAVAELEIMLREGRIVVVAFDDEQARLAHVAYQRFGKGNHAAKLNFADCAAYALARHLDAPLLFKGDDFAQTDITAAAPSAATP
jgi:ribonuclease VapC